MVHSSQLICKERLSFLYQWSTLLSAKQGVICAKNKTCWCMMSHCLVLMVWLWLLKLDSLLDCCPSNVLLFQHSQVQAWKFL